MEWTPDRRQGLQNHIFKSKLDKMFKYSAPILVHLSCVPR